MVKAAMTVLMPSWYYEKKDLKRSPSFLDGLDIERESRYRREGARFIINVGTKMGLRYDTMATGVVYFHRFYMFHSFKTFPRYVTACCCLFLAGKVEETPKKCKDIIRIARTFMTESQFAQFGDDPKEEVMTLERILLQTIKFDLQVDHPYGHLLKYAKCLKGDKNKLQNMVQMAWTFINDSLCTTLCLQWEPEVIAIALMYLAGKLSKFEVVDWVARVPRHTHWWDMFVEGMSIELLEDICHQVLDLYSVPIPNTPQDSPPATPPTKSTRKTSQPPSPIEASTSPAQIKPKEAVVGQPIPRLEPGELKRKTVPPEAKKEVQEIKIPRITEGKAIPTISNRSPKASNQVSNTQPSSPATPAAVENLVKNKPVETPTQRVSVSDAAFRSNISEVPPRNFTPGASFLQTERTAAKVAPTTYAASIPPPTASYTQSAPPFYTGINHESQAFPNVQQPPPQIFPQRHQFQHPPPPVPPSGPPPGLHPPPPRHQYSNIPPSGVPPFNTQFPPPRPPPNIINNPPPVPVPGITSHPPPPPPQGLPPHTGMMHSVPPPPPPGIPSYRPRSGVDLYNPQQELRGGRPPGPRGHFEKDFLLRRESEFDGPFPEFDGPFPEFDSSFSEFDPGYHMHSGSNQFGQDFERQPPPPRRFNLDHQNNRKRERGPHPPLMNNVPQQQGAPTGIPPVRITGSS